MIFGNIPLKNLCFACMEYKNLMIREAFPANAHPFERKNTKDRTVKNGNDVELLKAFSKL